MKTVLVVGPSVPASVAKEKGITVVHKPCISLVPLAVDKDVIKQQLARSDAILFTSKHAVQDLAKNCLHKEFSGTIFSIGLETSKAASCYFQNNPCLTASKATQEGVFSCILAYKKEHNLTALFWPRSLHARHFLSEALMQLEITLFDIPLYAPKVIPQTYCFESVDEILFTCPSSVMAFFSLVDKKEIAHLTLTPIGPITQKTLSTLLST